MNSGLLASIWLMLVMVVLLFWGVCSEIVWLVDEERVTSLFSGKVRAAALGCAMARFERGSGGLAMRLRWLRSASLGASRGQWIAMWPVAPHV